MLPSSSYTSSFNLPKKGGDGQEERGRRRILALGSRDGGGEDEDGGGGGVGVACLARGGRRWEERGVLGNCQNILKGTKGSPARPQEWDDATGWGVS